MGAWFARDGKAYKKWRAQIDRQTGRAVALSAAALESAVLNVARMFPGNVIRGRA